MKRITLHLSLLAAAALALTAFVGVATASAAGGFEAAEYPAHVTGAPISELRFTVGTSLEAHCKGSKFQAYIEKASRRLDPTMSETGALACGEGGSLAMNGCSFELAPDGKGGGTAAIGPAGCKPIELNWVAGGSCLTTIGSQAIPNISFSNNEKEGTVKFSAEEGTLTVSSSGGSSLCKNTKWMRLIASYTISAENQAGEHTTFQVSNKLPATIGLFVTGEKSESKEKQPRLAGEEYPVTVAGSQDTESPKKLMFSSNGGTLGCQESSGYSAQTLTSAAFSIPLQPNKTTEACTYRDNSEEEFAAEVYMNSCSYSLALLNSGPPYAGTLGIACEKEADKIEIVVANPDETVRCKYGIAAQTGLTGIHPENVGASYERSVVAHFEEVPVALTKLEGKLGLCGAGNQTDHYSGATTLIGTP